MHQLVDTRHLLPELREHTAIELPAARDMQLEGIGEATVDQHFIMKMRACRHAGGTDIADQVALAHLRAGFNAGSKAAHMAIGGLITIAVPDADIIAVA